MGLPFATVPRSCRSIIAYYNKYGGLRHLILYVELSFRMFRIILKDMHNVNFAVYSPLTYKTDCLKIRSFKRNSLSIAGRKPRSPAAGRYHKKGRE